jgi:FkbM family methyltransferase
MLPGFIRRSCARKFRRRNLGKALETVTLDGCRLRVVIGDNVDNEIAMTGGFEPHLSDLIRSIAAGAEGNFLDVGCHLGYYSTMVKRIAPAARITAVDANPVMAERCRGNLELNGFDGRVINCGVGSSHALLDFKCAPASPSLGTFGANPPPGFDYETIKVQVVPFREIMDQVEGVVFLLKMDVEGFEYQALSTLGEGDVARIRNIVFEFSDERLAQCGQSRRDFENLAWLHAYEIHLILPEGGQRKLTSLAEVPSGDQNVWLRRRD